MNLKDLAARKNALDKEMKAHGEDAVKGELAEFFAENPEVLAVRWTQYAPHFNDGEPCEFSVNEPEFKIPAEGAEAEPAGERDPDEDDDGYDDADLDEDSEDWIDTWGMDNARPKRIVTSARRLAKNLQSCEDALRAAFGDDAMIVCTREKITAHEYEHD